MANITGISWTDSTFNPWIGCQKVGPGCDHCYAEALMDTRWRRVQWGPGNPRQRTSAANWKQPLVWERHHAAFSQAHGHNRRVFCASLADVFDKEVPESWRIDLFTLIDATPHLTWLLLTKRVSNVIRMMSDVDSAGARRRGPRPNVWLGITVVNQAEVDRDVPKLLAVPARIRFLSIEPMLAPIRLTPWPDDPSRFWVICGGESGRGARAMADWWVLSLRNQCLMMDVPFFFKQWGGVTAAAGGCVLAEQEYKAWPHEKS